MRIFSLNAGSSSLKYQLFEEGRQTPVARGLVERIGEAEARLVQHGPGDKLEVVTPIEDHRRAMELVFESLAAAGVLSDPSELGAIGHRVVHGGEGFQAATLVTDAVLAGIEACIPLAPLHNPANLLGIQVCRELAPGVPQVAVFDTAFHQTMPPEAFRYAVPESWYEDLGVRRYGFHGTSHQYVSRRAAELCGRTDDDFRVVTLHLGNGASAAAIRGGRSVDTSMGLTPLEGLVMGTRTGDLDPAVPAFVARSLQLTSGEVDTLMNKASGMVGLCGDNDLRRVHARAEEGDARCRLALKVYAHRIRRYIGALAAVLGGIDALVFTGGVGENDARMRAMALEDMGFLGLQLDGARNGAVDGEAPIHPEGAAVQVWVIPTNEELEIASQAAAVVEGEG